MRLYTHPFSPPGRSVLVTAACLGIPLETVFVDAPAGEHRQPDYMKLNPNALFPTLQDGDFLLWESNAITQYLASSQVGNDLWSSDSRMRADITRWQCWQLAHWSPASRPFQWENFFKPLLGQGDPDPVELKRAEGDFRRFARVLDDHLAARNWLVGSGLTLADISVVSPLMYRQSAKMPIEDYANINRWFAQIEKLAAWRDTVPTMPNGRPT
ncbi:MAG: glutathione S-transferase family protein [Acidiferrobacterales bacterium]